MDFAVVFYASHRAVDAWQFGVLIEVPSESRGLPPGSPVDLRITGYNCQEAGAEIMQLIGGGGAAVMASSGGMDADVMMGGGASARAKTVGIWIFRLDPRGTNEIQVLLEHTSFGGYVYCGVCFCVLLFDGLAGTGLVVCDGLAGLVGWGV